MTLCCARLLAVPEIRKQVQKINMVSSIHAAQRDELQKMMKEPE